MSSLQDKSIYFAGCRIGLVWYLDTAVVTHLWDCKGMWNYKTIRTIILYNIQYQVTNLWAYSAWCMRTLDNQKYYKAWSNGLKQTPLIFLLWEQYLFGTNLPSLQTLSLNGTKSFCLEVVKWSKASNVVVHKWENRAKGLLLDAIKCLWFHVNETRW